ncbi:MULTISPECIES: dipeptide/oligopeptide/nickel ABC transporter permease/ATP-binding protein [Arthrobacter]|uniref:Dipeptide/oligopeptide/nickel ABC transporter permease/ATP-binding protein n=1 Tax=Arthrobacter terricola TaxID=2547396 RepID=A0A4R5KE66_9MICC|nr:MULTISPECIES: dipeptide/oligopeptide/nickel ABC transporter permease/ATP-binding protein [Arthrobacter]MBT8159699.1 dipeptide/oligopeptide/nickel ABC transporter permease/ATP-binding protein [Arthrobacter sp. GN70]TDF93649.1 dipeptide/oligopeptide/nickel ABC transporter permease/ATP-binding protein [Arthrobacter terricola]
MTSTAEITKVVTSTRPRRKKRHWLRSRKVLIGASILAVFAVIAIIGPWIAPYDPSATGPDVLMPPSAQHLLGTTALGEDVLSQVLAGTRLSIEVGFLAALISETVAILVGITSGYLGGSADEVLSLGTNIFLVIPVLPLQILIIAYLGNVSWVVTAAVIALTAWSHGARKLRAQTMSIRKRDYVEAARAAGEPAWRIVWFEILPNETAIIATGFLFSVLSGIVVQTGLAFLGLGDVASWSWGSVLRWSESSNAFLTGAWWWYVPPGICLALVGMGLALINLGIDEVVNPRLRGVGRVKTARERTGFSRRLIQLDHDAEHAATTPDDGNSVLEITGLRVDYQTAHGGLPAVRGVDLTLRRGEVLGIAGESGSGKSTLAFAVTRLLRAPGEVVGGSVKYFGRAKDGTPVPPLDVLSASQAQLRRYRWEETAVVFQAAMNSLNPVLTVRTQLEDTIRAHRPTMAAADREDRVGELLELVGIDRSRLGSYPHQLSGGQRQRVMIAMALALDPAVVIMDEPTTSLDVVVQRDIIRCIMDLRTRLDSSFIFITHDLSLLLEIADRIAVMYAGELVELGDAAQIQHQPRHPYTRRLLLSFPVLRGPRRKLAAIDGAAPNLRSIPTGCAFHTRCPLATDICAQQDPPLLALVDQPGQDTTHNATGDPRRVACHHVDETLQLRPVDALIQEELPR